MAALPRLVMLLVLASVAIVEAGFDVKKIKSNPDGNLAVGFKKGHIISGMYEVIVPEGDSAEKREVLIKAAEVKDSISMKFDAYTMVFSDWDGLFMLGDKVYTDKLGTLYFFHSDDECNKRVYQSQGGDVVVTQDTSLDKSDCSIVREKVKRTLDHFLTTPFRYMLSYPSIKLLNTPGFPGGDYVSGVTYGAIQCGQFTVTLPAGDEEEVRMIGISGPGVSDSFAMKFDHGTKVFGRWDGYFYLGDKVFSVEPHTLVVEKDDGSCEKTVYEKQGIKIAAVQKIPIKKDDCFLIKSKVFSVFEKVVGTSMISQEDREYITSREERHRTSISDSDGTGSYKKGKVNFISNRFYDKNKDTNKINFMDDNDYYNEDMLLSRKSKSMKIKNDFYDEDYSDYKKPKIRRIGDDFYDNKHLDYKVSKQEVEDLRNMKQTSQQIQQPSLHVSSTVVLPEQIAQGTQFQSFPSSPGNIATGIQNTRNQQLVSQSSTGRVGNIILADETSDRVGYIKGNQLVLPADSLKTRANTFFYQPGYVQQEGSLDGDVLNLQYNNVDASQQGNAVNVQLNDVSQQTSILTGSHQSSTGEKIYGSSREMNVPTSAVLINDNGMSQNLQYTTSQPIVQIQSNEADNSRNSVMSELGHGFYNKFNLNDLANTVLNRALSSSGNVIASDGSVSINKIIPLSVQQGLNEGNILNFQSNNVDLSETNKVSNIQINDISDDGQHTGQATVRFARSIPVYTRKPFSDQNEVINFQKNTVDHPGKVTNVQENDIHDTSPGLQALKLPTVSVDADPVKTISVGGTVRLGRSIPVYAVKDLSEQNEVVNYQKNTVDHPGKVTNVQENDIHDTSPTLKALKLPAVSVDIDPVKTISVGGTVRLGRSIPVYAGNDLSEQNEVVNYQKNTVDHPGKVTNIQENDVRDDFLSLQTYPSIPVDINPVKTIAVSGAVRFGRSIVQSLEPPNILNNQVSNVYGSVVYPNEPTVETSIQGNTILAPTGPNGIPITPDLKATQQTTVNIPANPLTSNGAFNDLDDQSQQKLYIDSNVILRPETSRQNQGSLIYFQEQPSQSGLTNNQRGNLIVSGASNPSVVKFMTFPSTSLPSGGQQLSLTPLNTVKLQSPVSTTSQESDVVNFQNNNVAANGQSVSNIQINDVSGRLQKVVGSPVVQVPPRSSLRSTGSTAFSANLSSAVASRKTGNVAVGVDVQPGHGNSVLIQNKRAKLPIPFLVNPKNVIMNVADSTNFQKKKK